MRLRTGLSVFLPFAAGYFLSYLFRSINAVLAGDLKTDLDLSAAQLGLVTSMYFLPLRAFSCRSAYFSTGSARAVWRRAF